MTALDNVVRTIQFWSMSPVGLLLVPSKKDTVLKASGSSRTMETFVTRYSGR